MDDGFEHEVWSQATDLLHGVKIGVIHINWNGEPAVFVSSEWHKFSGKAFGTGAYLTIESAEELATALLYAIKVAKGEVK
jgi:hypothetical protein